MPPTSEILLQRLRHFVLSEAETQRKELERQWRRPLGERVAHGRALEGLRIERIEPDGTVKLTCQTNESRFREGDFLVLHRGEPASPEALEVVLEFDAETRLEVSVQDGDPFLLESFREGWFADEGMLDLSRFYLDTLNEVADTVRGRERILPLLHDDLGPQIDYAKYTRAWETAVEAGLNETQAEAVAQGYASDLVHLIQGPPGTGKTFVLAHLAKLLAEDGLRVFVTALTHKAINNALNKIGDVACDLPICKVGRKERADDLRVENFQYFSESGFANLEDGYIVGGTPFATRTKRLANVEFDVVLFDETSQITLPLALMAMVVGDRYVFIGDDCQLPPVTVSRGSPQARQSIFSYLNGRGYETMLATTYRLNASLARWPSETFYDGLLVPHPDAADRRLSLPALSGKWAEVLDPDKPFVYVDSAQHNTRTRSTRERDAVVELVLTLLEGNVPAEEIGVVTPYRAQGRAVRNLLRRTLPDPAVLPYLIVDTVERMQGQEREVVIVSLTTSSPAFAAQIADFFFQPQRLNVAITRPRTKLIIVGSRNVLEAEPPDPEHMGWVALFADLLSYAVQFPLPAAER